MSANMNGGPTTSVYYPPRRPYFLDPLASCVSSGCLGCGGLLFPFVFVALLAVLLQYEAPVTRKFVSGKENATDKVAIIRIEDMISSNTGFVNDQIDDAFKDDAVKAVVLRVDSPGGTVSSSDYYYDKITKLRKKRDIPVVVSMGGVCASGGYYIAMAVGNENDEVIFAEPTTWTGSIGVIIPHYDLSGLAEEWGIVPDSIKSHELKGMGGMLKPLTERERKILQSLVDDAFARFKQVIYTGRRTFRDDPAKLDAIATGQVFTTNDAVQNGLVDRVGYLEDAVQQAVTLAGLDAENTEVFTYRNLETFSSFLESAQSRLEENQVDLFRKCLTPRACYLWTVN
ncbi:MAG: signal peptide peptidase SppA [Planctomycetia bacterium]|nr:signal peptide peptidase SppA [Planctomycetia bacterium]